MNKRQAFIDWLSVNRLKNITPVKFANLLEMIFMLYCKKDVWSIDDPNEYNELCKGLNSNRILKKTDNGRRKKFVTNEQYYYNFLKENKNKIINSSISNKTVPFKKVGWDKYETALLIEAFWKIEDNGDSRTKILTELSNTLRQKAINQGQEIDDKFRNYNGMAIQLANISASFFPERASMHKTAIFEEIANLFKNNRTEFNHLLEEAHKLVGISDNRKEKNYESQKVDFYNKIELSFTKPTKIFFEGNIKIGFDSWTNCYGYIMKCLYKHYANIFTSLASDPSCTLISNNSSLLRRPVKITDDLYFEGNRSASELIRHVKIMLDKCGVNYENVIIEYDDKSISTTLSPNKAEMKTEEKKEEIFDVSDYNSVIQEIFPDGYAYTNPLRKKKFAREYAEIVGHEFTDTDSDYLKKIRQVGFISEDKVYLTSMISGELKENIKKFIDSSFENHSPVIYYSAIYEAFNTDLNSVFSENMLKKYIEFEYKDMYSFTDMAVMPKDKQIDLKQIVIDVFLNCGRPLDIEKIYSELPNISHDAIDSIIRDRDFIVNYRGKSYFYKEIFVIDNNELESISRFIEKTIKEKETVSGDELYHFINDKVPNLIEENPEVTDLGFKNVLKLKLADRFNFKGDVISAFGQELDVRTLFTNFCKRREKFTFSELEDFRDTIHKTYIDWDGVLMQSVRINNNTFVRRDFVDFDVQKIDEAVSDYCVKDYISFNDVINYTEFPPVGYAWNNYILESYLFMNSKSFKLVHAAFNADKPVGGIVKLNSNINNFDDLLIKIIKNGKLFDREKAFNFLLENDFIRTRKIKNIDLLIEKAKKEG